MTPAIGAPIDVRQLFRPLDDQLIGLLQSLEPADWQRQTVAKRWTVKDVAAHLLDGNIRLLSLQRDRYFGDTPPAIDAYESLVEWLNGLNADWVKAAKRISPGILLLLHQATRELVNPYYETLDLYEEAIFPVSWAGESKSLNWMHLAREYTEKWHHQQQIREATGREGILTKEFFFPMIDTFFRGLPYALRNAPASPGATIRVTITSDIGGDWYLKKAEEAWGFYPKPEQDDYAATVSLQPEIAWKLFSKSIRPEAAGAHITGDAALALQVLNLVAVMA